MLLAPQDIEALDEALRSGACILTPNYRSSDQLIDELCRHRLRHGAGPVQLRPPVKAIDPWLQECWSRLALQHGKQYAHWQVMSGPEELRLWRRIVRDNAEDLVLLQEDSAAQSLAGALRLLQQWQVPLSSIGQWAGTGLAGQPLDDLQWAWHWLQIFNRHCEQHRLLTFSGMVQLCIDALQDHALARDLLPVRLLLWGFGSPPPLYASLFETLERSPCPTAHFTPRSFTPGMQADSFSSAVEECQAAATWAADLLERHPGARIGLICPDPGLLRNSLHRIVDQALAGREHLVSSSAATPCSAHPWFATILPVLSLVDKQIPLMKACALLRSPRLSGAAEEYDARAALECRLRDKDELHVQVNELQRLARQADKPWHCPVLDELLAQTRRRWSRQSQARGNAEWFVLIEEHLASWLPRRRLDRLGDNTLLQSVDHFFTALQYDKAPASRLSRSDAFKRLHDLLQTETLREHPRQTPLMLLSPTAAAGMHFTHLWCMNMNEGLWPAPERLHPWIPPGLQREHAMPGADPGAFLEAASMQLRQMLERTSEQARFSYATHADDIPLRPGPLLPPGLDVEDHPAGPHAGLPLQLAAIPAARLETVEDKRVLPAARLQGRSRLLELQASCPFRAFAEERLSIKPLNTPGFGLSARAIGILVHDVLRHFWQRLGNSAALRACDEARLQEHIDAAVTEGLNSLGRSYPLTLTPGLRELEQQRLSGLLRQWMEIELTRPDFVIHALESDAAWQFDGLQLKLRLDRVDAQDDALVVIDYKTGLVNSNTWDATSPAQFQLLLYLLALEQQDPRHEVKAVLYARLNPRGSGYAGIAADAGVMPGLDMHNKKLKVQEPDWSALKQRWQAEIGALARELLDGYAAVEPRQGSATCSYCELDSLCRIRELRAAT